MHRERCTPLHHALVLALLYLPLLCGSFGLSEDVRGRPLRYRSRSLKFVKSNHVADGKWHILTWVSNLGSHEQYSTISGQRFVRAWCCQCQEANSTGSTPIYPSFEVHGTSSSLTKAERSQHFRFLASS